MTRIQPIRRRGVGLRRGVSLVEMLVVITLGGVVMGGVATGAAALLRVNQRVQTSANASQQAEQLARRLRADLRGASRASWDADEQKLRLSLPDSEEVTYKVASGRVLRQQGGAALPFRLPPGATLHCPAAAASEPDYFEAVVQTGESRGLPVAVCLGGSRRLMKEGGSP